jgi:hypothetical protein
MRLPPVLLALTLLAAACGQPARDGRFGVERLASDIPSIGPLTAFEWDLLGTWTVDSTDDVERLGVFGSVGETCELDGEHRLTCLDASGEPDGNGWWLADVDSEDPEHGWITYVLTDASLGGTVEISLDGDTIVPQARADTLWRRQRRPARHKRPTELALNWFEALVIGTWTTPTSDDQFGSRCMFARDLTFSCDSTRGTWSGRRGLDAPGAASIQPQLTTTTDGESRVRSVSFDTSGMRIGAGEAVWIPTG